MNIILKKSLALVLAVVMIVGLFPHALYAGEAETGENTAPAALTPADTADENMTLSKTAVRTGEDTWDVTLTATPKDHAVKPVPSEVILVLDHTGSMTSSLNGSTRWNTLVNVLMEPGGLLETLSDLNASVALMTFDKQHHAEFLNNGGFYSLGMSEELAKIKRDINALPSPTSGTYLEDAFAKSRELLESLPAGGRPEVILLTDGENYYDVRSSSIPEIVTMRENIVYIKERAELYGISFANGAKGDADLRYLLGAENVYTSDDYAGLKKNFEDISIKIRALITDPMSEWVTCTSQPTVEVSGANGETYPPAVLKDEYVSWTPEPGQEIEPGQTVTIK